MTIILTIIPQEHLTKLLILRHLQQTSLKIRVSSASNTTRNIKVLTICLGLWCSWKQQGEHQLTA